MNSCNNCIWAGLASIISVVAIADDETKLPVPKPAPERPAELSGGAPDSDDETLSDQRVDTVRSSASDDSEQDQTDFSVAMRSADDIAQCESALDELNVVYRVIEPVSGQGGCGIPRPYEVDAVADIIIQPTIRVRCETALAMARWATTIVEPAASVLVGPNADDGGLSAIQTAASYICRRRNNQPDGKISEHGYGNAVDISGFVLANGTMVPIAPRDGDSDLAKGFQRTARAGSCLFFTTVLGPGSDDYHDDHLHLDIVERQSGYRLCQ